MEQWREIDDSLKSFKSINSILKDQGNYFDRLVGFFASKKILTTFNARILTKGFDKLHRVDAAKRVLLIANHRSYLDPVILHYILTLNGNAQPRVVALDFIAKTPLAPMFRKMGAVFIKGSFTDPTYREKMNQEVRTMLDNGEWLEFYLEGQRSLSGKQMDPRHGLLTALLDKECVIYPINISYERIIEDRDFATKTGFNFLNSFQALFNPGKGAGNVYATVGERINTVVTTNSGYPREVAMRVTEEIMKNNVLQGTDLIATILLHRQENILLSDLKKQAERLGQALRVRGVIVAPLVLEESLKLLKHCITQKRDILSISDKTLLIYYRNRALYALIDLVPTEYILRKEKLWAPLLPPSQEDREWLTAIAKHALEPTIFLYKYLVDMIKGGERSVTVLRATIEDNPHSCYELVGNLIAVLKENGEITVEGDMITVIV